MRRLPADEPQPRVFADVERSLRQGFRRRVLGLLVTSVILAGSTAAATVAATTAAERLLTTPSSAGAPRPGGASIRVEFLPFTRTAAGGVEEGGHYAVVSGHRDPAVQERVNGILREPVDHAHPLARFVGGNPATLATEAEVTLQKPRLLSVLYRFSIVPREDPEDPAGGNWVKNFYESWSVIVDLTDGRRLGARDLFLPATLTTTGRRTLVEQLIASKQSPCPGRDPPRASSRPREADRQRSTAAEPIPPAPIVRSVQP